MRRGRAKWAERLRALLHCDRGGSAVELAIVVPAVAALLTGTVDLAQLANQGLNLDAALRAGASNAIGCNPLAHTSCGTKIGAAVTAYAASLGGTVTVSFINANSSDAWYPRYCTWDNGTTVVACDNSVVCVCDAAQSQCPKHTYVKMQAVQTLPPPLIPLSIMPATLTRTLMVRVQ
jgi:Flp pilus assembly protein TadG